eukprot:CCRYP_018960-RA/>CCRYP_018960-RA protein AED:0.23 eAED:0.23 QI:171/1/1/1/0/1/2/654/93
MLPASSRKTPSQPLSTINPPTQPCTSPSSSSPQLLPLHRLCSSPRSTVSRTVIRAEDTDYEKEFAKLQKEAEERLDDKVAELMSNIETVGQKK